MRVLLNTNILVSYLLLPHDPIRLVVHAALAGAYELLIPEALLDELAATIAAKDQLRTRIPADLLSELISDLKEVATEIPHLTDEIPPLTKEPKDDYLIAYAIEGAADILVNGNRDLLLLGTVGDLNFLSPEDLVRLVSWVPED